LAADSFPDLRFVLPLIGWPIDVTEQGFHTWRSNMAKLARCENVAVNIFGAECIFGLDWTGNRHLAGEHAAGLVPPVVRL
jgi:predicted TIM-barrel fold metal-dependent hydrolase